MQRKRLRKMSKFHHVRDATLRRAVSGESHVRMVNELRVDGSHMHAQCDQLVSAYGARWDRLRCGALFYHRLRRCHDREAKASENSTEIHQEPTDK